MVKIKKIGALSAAKIFGISYALLGFVGGAVLSLIFLIEGGGTETNVLFGLGAIVFIPLFYGILGAVAGYFMALTYNVTAKWFGGLEIETEK